VSTARPPVGGAYLEQVHQDRRSHFAAALSGWTDHDRQTFADSSPGVTGCTI
jgi:hypothetical protein